MDKNLSARVNESVLLKIASLASRLRTSKRKIIESAIEMYGAKIESEQGTDVFDQTCGAWTRKETADQIVHDVRKEFQDSMTRHQK